MSTKIPWTNDSWNPVTGCSPVSEGCQNCYAARMAKRLAGRYGYPKDDPFKITVHEDKFWVPFKWKKPRRVFVCSMSDLFHKDIPCRIQDQIMAIIMLNERHVFQVLTKRPKIAEQFFEQRRTIPSNLWFGVSAENQKRGDERIPPLLEISAAIRFVSLEPLLEPIDLDRINLSVSGTSWRVLDWVIIGCESGPGRRECKIEWIRDIVRQCQEANVAVFVKQISINGRVSHDPAEWPEDFRVQEYPDDQVDCN